MTTVRDVITRALRTSGVNGVGQSPSAEDINDGLTTLNNMMALWSRRRWLVYDLVETAIQSTGALSYTVGPGGSFNIARPDRIEAAFVRIPGTGLPVDYSLYIIQSREDYSAIAIKTASSFPQALFYDSGYPTGQVYVVGVPSATYEIHILTKAVVGGFTSLSTTILLPPEYFEAIDYNLALRFCTNYSSPIPPGVTALAKSALGTLRGANTQIGALSMPTILMNKHVGSAIGSQGGADFINSINIALLPTTLPATSGILWNNGGLLSVS